MAQQFKQAEQVIDASKQYVATIKTAKGDIVVELSKSTPITTNSFVFLAGKGYYDGLTFHRVEPGFVVQGGDPTGTGSGGPGYRIKGEFEGAVFDKGVFAMARTSDPNSAGSQFFITLGDAHHLDGQYAAFGRVTQGMDVAQKIAVGDVMESVTVQEQ
jgi:cyclophilin family peptidyl-prolyl cis-trans isomerase